VPECVCLSVGCLCDRLPRRMGGVGGGGFSQVSFVGSCVRVRVRVWVWVWVVVGGCREEAKKAKEEAARERKERQEAQRRAEEAEDARARAVADLAAAGGGGGGGGRGGKGGGAAEAATAALQEELERVKADLAKVWTPPPPETEVEKLKKCSRSVVYCPD
jgi:hypothetical protein